MTPLLLFWIKASVWVNICRMTSYPHPSSFLFMQTYFVFISKAAPSSPLPTLCRLCNICVYTPHPIPSPLLWAVFVALRSHCFCLKSLFWFSILISLCVMCTRALLVHLVLHGLCPDCSLTNPSIHSLAEDWSQTCSELARGHRVNSRADRDCTEPDYYYFACSPSGSYLPY